MYVVLLPNAYYVFQSMIVPNIKTIYNYVEALAQGLPRDRVARVGPKPVEVRSVLRRDQTAILNIFFVSPPRLSRCSRSALSLAASLLHSAQGFLLRLDCAMDSIKDQVSNLTLYDLKAGVRKVQNGRFLHHACLSFSLFRSLLSCCSFLAFANCHA